MKGWKKKFNLKNGTLLIFTLVFSLVFLTACGAPKLPAGLDEGKIEGEAKKIITLLNEKNEANNDVIREMGTDKLKVSFTDDIFAQVYGLIDEVGEFKELGDHKILGSEEDEKEYGVAVIRADYENGRIVFSISFDTDMKLAGIFLQ